jgi:hypothetical protein
MERALYNAARRLGVLVLGILLVLCALIGHDWLRSTAPAGGPPGPRAASALALTSLFLVAVAAAAWHGAWASLERAARYRVPSVHPSVAYRTRTHAPRGDSPELPAAARKAALSLMLLSLALTVVVVAAVVR